MSITVKFFGSLREKVGQSDTSITFTTTMSVLQVWEQASSSMTLPDNILCAINMEYVELDHAVADGDEVAFFPPVTGG